MQWAPINAKIPRCNAIFMGRVKKISPISEKPKAQSSKIFMGLEGLVWTVNNISKAMGIALNKVVKGY